MRTLLREAIDGFRGVGLEVLALLATVAVAVVAAGLALAVI